ncbi:hypothetical protein BGZ70_000044 [Mortierella alpina]|uniref:Uncharacterized protein n=1 Tax=Mortierella alpina TaxID=64518 RepID=A0A9P6M656_MORAP|nr:hypothetical protein BGZ70_000044 [Mortierella alpina]
MPFLYRSLSLTYRSTSSSHATGPLPSPEALLVYSHLVQELYVDLDSIYSLALQQQNSSRVTKPRPIGAVRRQNEVGSTERDPSALSTIPLGPPSWNSGIFSLSLLHCYSCTFTGSKEQFPEMAATVTSNLTELQLQGTSGEGNLSLVEWLEICPHLESVSVRRPKTPWFGSASQFRTGPHLYSLNLDCGRLQDAELAEVLTRSTALRELALENATITRPVFEALSDHFGSLTHLDFQALPTIEQWMIRWILKGASRLAAVFVVSLEMDRFYSSMSHDVPWACRGSLRELCITTLRMSLDASVNDRFMRRLMDLKHLEEVFTMAIYSGDGTGRPLHPASVPGDTSEAHFLAKLCEFRNWELSGRDLREDLRWKLVRDTWPRLLSFSYNGRNGEYDE